MTVVWGTDSWEISDITDEDAKRLVALLSRVRLGIDDGDDFAYRLLVALEDAGFDDPTHYDVDVEHGDIVISRSNAVV